VMMLFIISSFDTHDWLIVSFHKMAWLQMTIQTLNVILIMVIVSGVHLFMEKSIFISIQIVT
jgi:hypothetical protein